MCIYVNECVFMSMRVLTHEQDPTLCVYLSERERERGTMDVFDSFSYCHSEIVRLLIFVVCAVVVYSRAVLCCLWYF